MDYLNESSEFNETEYECRLDSDSSLYSKYPHLTDLLFALETQGVTDKQRSIEVFSYIKRKAWERGIPISGSFELTPMCNLDCNMCYVHGNNIEYRFDDLLPINAWIDFIDQAYNHGMMFAQLTGGECLIYPGFNEIYLHLRSKGIATTVLTNGVLIDKKRIEFFEEYKPSSIQISIYGSNDDAYEAVTGHRAYHKVIDAIQMLREAGLSVVLAVTVSRPMIPDLPNLIKLINDLGVPCRYNYDLAPPYKDVQREFDDIRLSTDEIVRVRQMFLAEKDILIEKKDLNTLPQPLCELGGCRIGRGMPCGSGRSTFAINWKGEMLPCNTVGTIIRTLATERFADAWRHVNQWAVNHIVLQGCEACGFTTVCARCALMHELCTGKEGGVDAEYCHMIRKCVSEGVIKI